MSSTPHPLGTSCMLQIHKCGIGAALKALPMTALKHTGDRSFKNEEYSSSWHYQKGDLWNKLSSIFLIKKHCPLIFPALQWKTTPLPTILYLSYNQNKYILIFFWSSYGKFNFLKTCIFLQCLQPQISKSNNSTMELLAMTLTLQNWASSKKVNTKHKE